LLLAAPGIANADEAAETVKETAETLLRLIDSLTGMI
jgi:hypothetical protein